MPPVHPRASGEHLPTTGPVSSVCGSSPRQRGTRLHTEENSSPSRFIPAPAGNTVGLRGLLADEADHPRASGEHLALAATVPVASGSSPRQRGTQAAGDGCGGLGRFIPAPAGNTSARNGKTEAMTVHPRASGEHRSHCPPRQGTAGSSPRQRGTLLDRGLHDPVRRFIPAPAGNTHLAARYLGDATVHPRASGEHDNSPKRWAQASGSSPRQRGTRELSPTHGG